MLALRSVDGAAEEFMLDLWARSPYGAGDRCVCVYIYIYSYIHIYLYVYIYMDLRKYQ